MSLRGKEKTCPFCRTPAPTSDKENIKRLKKRMEVGDAQAMYNLGCCYDDGNYGFPRDYAKALELYHRAGELGFAEAYNNIGHAYRFGRGVERDERKADHYYALASIRGHAAARHNLGVSEGRAGNWDRATKHWLIAAGRGNIGSVKTIQKLYKVGQATREDYQRLCKHKHIKSIWGKLEVNKGTKLLHLMMNTNTWIDRLIV